MEARRGAVRGVGNDHWKMFDEAPFGKNPLPLAEAGRAAVCGGASGARVRGGALPTIGAPAALRRTGGR